MINDHKRIKKQLKPVMDIDTKLLDTPDIFLDEIHRQALDNPIIRLSMDARNKIPINYGTYDGIVSVIQSGKYIEEYNDKIWLKPDQIICGKNSTRLAINDHVRNLLGYNDSLPVIGDKLICKANNREIYLNDKKTYLVNGMIGYCKASEIYKATPLEVMFRTEFYKSSDKRLKKIFEIDFQPDFLSNNNIFTVEYDPNYIDAVSPNEKEYDRNKKMTYFQYGYAITCHASQGSEFDKLTVYNEILNYKEHHKWLYTAITRASKKLLIIQ